MFLKKFLMITMFFCGNVGPCEDGRDERDDTVGISYPSVVVERWLEVIAKGTAESFWLRCA